MRPCARPAALRRRDCRGPLELCDQGSSASGRGCPWTLAIGSTAGTLVGVAEGVSADNRDRSTSPTAVDTARAWTLLSSLAGQRARDLPSASVRLHAGPREC